MLKVKSSEIFFTKDELKIFICFIALSTILDSETYNARIELTGKKRGNLSYQAQRLSTDMRGELCHLL